MQNKFIIIIFLLATAFSLRAQNLEVSGTVRDAESHLPVTGARLTDLNQPGHQAVTDIDGFFRLKINRGDSVRITHPDYIAKVVRITSAHPVIEIRHKAVMLHQVIVTADPLRDAVHSVSINDRAKQISQPRNVADLFADVPGFSIQKRSNTSMEPSLYAFKYEQMNVRYDGSSKMVNACPNRMDPATAHIIPEDVSKIEVIKGPFSVRFGQSFGATVNMVTRKPRDYGPGFHGAIEGGYETNGQNRVVRSELVNVTGKWAYGVEGEYRKFGDYTDGSGVVTPAGFTTLSYSLKAGYMPRKGRHFYAHWHQKFGRDIKHAGLPMDSPVDDSYLINLGYDAKEFFPKTDLSIKTYASYVDHLMTNGYRLKEPRPNYPGIDARTPVYSRTFGGKVELTRRPDKNTLWYFGSDADIIQRDGNKTVIVNVNPNTGQPMNPPVVKHFSVWQGAQINDFGLYAEYHRKLRNGLYLTGGVRADAVYSFARHPDPGLVQIYGDIKPVTHFTLSGNIALKYRHGDWQWEAALGRGTRTPSMLERYIYRFTVGEDARQYIGNPYLKPETNNQLQLGLRKRWNNLQAGADLFASYFQNYITAVINPSLGSGGGGCTAGPPMAPRQFQNVEAYQYGFTALLAAYLTPELRFHADFSLTKAYNLSLDEPLAQVAPATGHVGLKYQRGKYWFDLRSELVAAQNDFSPSFGETATPGHITYDFRAGWQPNKHLSVGAAVLNLTDAAYYNHLNFAFRNNGTLNGRRIYEPGRNFSFYLKYRF